ncbi:lysine N(6)-hydroxylase/L-ornithine N(5)-oxygenase family protein [Streptomyces tubbatahanensis]|uniref:Lysine N(6)-hydroxylase/L-ornithine N(5)-oxygenase family protein n=1 Tax=Streptomyces tubbatahanensis TaxID=2923272 RepID=A0ABY3Y037_9ACTN|nr:NAD(P)-binding domain-containing protein [Streptomyces tubbatahanensis]UNT00168.1 lysine N(6)-hydroxylase/L-ornithine N(5)-oxygenase family protein [Streptomyces tubbatahanensis]
MYDLVVVGAGPYGLSVASHAAAAGLNLRLLGRPMASWRDHMPRGMFLKSEPDASTLSDPAGAHTLAGYCAERGIEVAHGNPLPLDTFTEYGTWFGRNAAPPADEQTVTRVSPRVEGFLLETADGERMMARAVVLAVGVLPFAQRPPALGGLPTELVTHSTHHRDLSRFAGKDVTVVGAGQAALETSALLAEQGARVRVVARAPRIDWNAPPQPLARGRLTALRDPHSALGTGWPSWVWSRLPSAVRRLPASTRLHIARHALGPAGAWWLRERFETAVPTLLGHTITAADRTAPGVRRVGGVLGERVRLWLAAADGTASTLETDHVVAATGFTPDLSRLGMLDSSLREGLRRVGTGDAPWLDARFQSSCPGLFFAGLLTAPSFGPAMRFVHGASFTAPRLLEGVLRHRSQATTATAVTGVPASPGAREPEQQVARGPLGGQRHTRPAAEAPSASGDGTGRLPAPVSGAKDAPEAVDARKGGGRAE